MNGFKLYRGCITDLSNLTGLHRTTISKVANGSRRFTTEQRQKIITTLPCPKPSRLKNLSDTQLIKLWHEIGTVQHQVIKLIKRSKAHGRTECSANAHQD